RLGRGLYNLVSQATGLGLTANNIDCYAALIRLWQPGDRIFLFGFSRGAYTVRCLAGAIALCGIPALRDGSALPLDQAAAKRVARQAIKRVYQHTSSKKEEDASARERELLTQRRALAAQFRQRYGSANGDVPNVAPHFIGVFDT